MTNPEQAVTQWGIVADWSLLIVLIGAIGALCAELGGWIQEHKLKTGINRASLVLTVIGTALGLGAQHQLGDYNSLLTARINHDAQVAKQRAAELGVTTDNLDKFVKSKVAETDKVIRSLNDATERANKLLVVVQQRQLSRHVTRQQIAILKRTLRPGVHIYVQWLATGETQDFAGELEEALYSSPGGDHLKGVAHLTNPEGRTGLIVAYHHDNPDSKSVWDALQAASLNPTEEPAPANLPGPYALITVAPRVGQ